MPKEHEYLTISHVARRLNPSRPPHRSTVIRWIKDGIRDAQGSKVRLPAMRFGRKYYIRPRDLETFGRTLAEQPPASENQTPTPRSQTDRERDAEDRQAERMFAEAK